MGATTKSGRTRNRRALQASQIRSSQRPPLVLYGFNQTSSTVLRASLFNSNGEQQTSVQISNPATAIVAVAFTGAVEEVAITFDTGTNELVFTFATAHEPPDSTVFLGNFDSVHGPNGEEIAAALYEWTA